MMYPRPILRSCKSEKSNVKWSRKALNKYWEQHRQSVHPETYQYIYHFGDPSQYTKHHGTHQAMYCQQYCYNAIMPSWVCSFVYHHKPCRTPNTHSPSDFEEEEPPDLNCSKLFCGLPMPTAQQPSRLAAAIPQDKKVQKTGFRKERTHIDQTDSTKSPARWAAPP